MCKIEYQNVIYKLCGLATSRAKTKMRKHFHQIFLITIFLPFLGAEISQVNAQLLFDKTAYRFFIVSDIGQNGYYEQKTVAETLGKVAEQVRPKFVISSGDTFHYNGVRSSSDPLWLSNFENIYTNPWLLVNWYPILGNHEYRGNTQALIDYSEISRRWNMPARYYTFAMKIDSVNSIRIVMMDTPPFINEYKKYPDQYPDIQFQSTKAQLKWLDKVLSNSTEKWKIVVGHHPVYSVDSLRGNHDELIEQIEPILMRHNVDFYFSGHIHIAQHIQKNGIEYVISPSGSQSVDIGTNQGAKFLSYSEGFTVCQVKENYFEFVFVDKNGNEIYRYKKNK